MPRSLADGKIKFTILTDEPVDPAHPTVTELNAGIDASCAILSSDFTWTATDSDKVSEKALCEDENAEALGAGNYSLGITPFRYFDETTKNSDTTEDEVWTALKAKGTRFWGYARETAKKSTDPWVAADEIYLGAEVLTDTPQKPSDQGGYTKRRIPLVLQKAYDNILAAAAGS